MLYTALRPVNRKDSDARAIAVIHVYFATRVYLCGDFFEKGDVLRMKEKSNSVRIISESAVMIALGTILSLFKLVEMPYGGAVTLASALPIGVISYRHGIRAGLASALVYGAVQQLLGISNLSYFTSWQSIVAIIMLDYILAFTAIGLTGLFRGRLGLSSEAVGKRQRTELALGMLLVMILRYICHTISGATVWAGLSIPTGAALLYSLGYNATYMIPEAIISVAVTGWIGERIDFGRKIPVRIAAVGDRRWAGAYLYEASLLVLLATLIADTVLIFPHLQDPDSGVFTFGYLSEINWVALVCITAAGVGIAAACFLLKRCMDKRCERAEE